MKQTRSLMLTQLRRVALPLTLLMVFNAYASEPAEVTQLVRAGKLTEALAKAEQYLASKPKDPQMRFLKGVIQRDTGKVTEAINTFTQLTEDFPESPEPYNNLAVLYAGQGHYDKSRIALEMAIRTNPSYATAHENLGDVYAKLASQAYNKALQLDNANTGVPPKLALIRELFSVSGIKPQRPGLGSASHPQAGNVKPPPAAAAPAASAPAAAAVAASPPRPAPVPASTPAPTVSSAPGAPDAQAAVKAWASAWAGKDVAAYLASYGSEFTPPGGVNRDAWEKERRARIEGKSSIKVTLEHLSIETSGNKATAKFRQLYKADGLTVSGRKTLDLVKTGDRWYIVKESAGG